MAAQSPIVPADLAPLTGGLLACDSLRELLSVREKMQEFLAWLLADDSSGNLGADFLLGLSQQFLYDAAKKGYFVRANPTTGYLELVQYVPISSLDVTGAVAGDYFVFNGTVWAKQTPVYAAPTSGGTTIPAPNTGAVCKVAHGLGAVPKLYGARLECNTADANYAVGQRVDALSLSFLRNGTTDEVRPAVNVFADATDVGVTFGIANTPNGGDRYQLLDMTTFKRTNITAGSWDVKLFALP